MSGLTDQVHNELSLLCHSIEIATDEHGDGATLMLEPASRLAEGLGPWVAAREATAEKRGAERALLEAELEIRDAVTIPVATRASVCAVLRGRARRATEPTP